MSLTRRELLAAGAVMLATGQVHARAARGPGSLDLWLGHSSMVSISNPVFRNALAYASIGR